MNFDNLNEQIRKLKESMPEPVKKPIAIWINTKDYELVKEIAEPHNTYGIDCQIYNDIIIYESPNMKEGHYHPLYPIDFNEMPDCTNLRVEAIKEAKNNLYFTDIFYRL